MSAPSQGGVASNVYSANDSEIWGGTSTLGSEMDLVIRGNNLTNENGTVTGYTAYWYNDPLLAVSGFARGYGELSTGWSEKLFYQEFMGGNDYINAAYGVGVDRLLGHSGADEIHAGGGDDFVHGNHGADKLWGNDGNDIIRGGHGPDSIDGGNGSDWIWGGTGKNVITAGWNDGRQDQIYVPADRVKNSSFGNPGGANADIIKGLGREDLLFIHGVDDSSLSFAQTTYDGSSGIGIYSEGVLEAFVQGYGWTASQVNAITNGGFYA
jgi:Ca2+-binding RTX toxin-like protein